jgi:hypothetical protein
MPTAMPESIFHYTKFSCLQSIVHSRQLWASDLQHTNDSRELIHGLTLGLRALATADIDRLDPEKRAVQEPIFARRRELMLPMRDDPPRVYACSFSERCDSLSQWRGYANDGTGVCIGFSVERLQELTAKQPFTLLRCDYCHVTGHGGTWGEDSLLAHLNPHRATSHDNESRAIILKIARVKDWGFSDEAEVRLVHAWDGSLPSHPHRSVGDYVAFDLSADHSLAMVSIDLCPSPADGLSVDSIREYLGTYGLHNVSVRRSQVPFRSVSRGELGAKSAG